MTAGYEKFLDEIYSNPEVGEDEAYISRCVDDLLRANGVSTIPQVRTGNKEYNAIPDFAVLDSSNMHSGYVEIKGSKIDVTRPDKFTEQNKDQWEVLSTFPHVVYTNGKTWVNYTYGTPVNTYSTTDEDDENNMTTMLNTINNWTANQITDSRTFIDRLSPAVHTLQSTIHDGMVAEYQDMSTSDTGEGYYPFNSLMKLSDNFSTTGKGTWDDTSRGMSDEIAQTLTFLILNAHVLGLKITDDNGTIPDQYTRGFLVESMKDANIWTPVVVEQTIKGVQNAPNPDRFWSALDIITNIIAVADWDTMQAGDSRDLWRHLYEDFLDTYDRDGRFNKGAFYTPEKLASGMINLTDEVCQDVLGKGLLSGDLNVLDMAVGTGTFPIVLMDKFVDSLGNIPAGQAALKAHEFLTHISCWELSMTPFTVFKMRLDARLKELGGAGTNLDGQHIRMGLRDSLVGPGEGGADLSDMVVNHADGRAVAEQVDQMRGDADNRNFDVVIGNPPYDKTKMDYPWITGKNGILNDWRGGVNGGGLGFSNLAIGFMRQALWQLWEKVDGSTSGVMSFVMPSAWLTGRDFATLRSWLRDNAEQVWVANISPEGWMGANNVFGINTPVSVVIIARGEDWTPGTPATIRYRAVDSVDPARKLADFDTWVIGDSDWEIVEGEGMATFVPQTDVYRNGLTPTSYLPHSHAGSKAGRKWASAASESTLDARITALSTMDHGEAVKSYKTNGPTGYDLTTQKNDRDGDDVRGTVGKLLDVGPLCPEEDIDRLRKSVPVTTRAMVREHLIANVSTIEAPHYETWGSATVPGNQFFVTGNKIWLQTNPIFTLSSIDVPQTIILPESNERVHPTHNPDGSPNVAPGMLEALSDHYGFNVTVTDLHDYMVGMTTHPAFKVLFAEDVQSGELRIPLTGEADLFRAACEAGHRVADILGHYGADTPSPTSLANGLLSWPQAQFGYTPAPTQKPKWTLTEGDPDNPAPDDLFVMEFGDNIFADVPRRVKDYKIGMTNMLKLWTERRMNKPYGKSMSPLDKITPTVWEKGWSEELYRMLCGIDMLCGLHDQQEDILMDVMTMPTLNKADLEGMGVVFPTGKVKAKWPKVAGADTESLF